jgi:hypothetical protein
LGGGSEIGVMNWDAIGAVAELVGAAGVIVSLVYLAGQIRQSTRSSRAATFHAVAAEASHLYRTIAGDSESARIFRQGMREPESLTEDDLVRFSAMLSSAFRGLENMFVQYRQGTIDEESWQAWRRSLLQILEQPGAARVWQLRGDVFREDFQHLVNELARADFPRPGQRRSFEMP